MGVPSKVRRPSGPRMAALVLAGAAALALSACHPPPRISVADALGTEVTREVVFPVTLNASGASNPRTSHVDVQLFCTTTAGTATSVVDFVPWAGQQCGVIDAGEFTTDVRVQVVPDAVTESGIESFTLDVRPEGGGVGVVDGRALGLIKDR